MRLIVNGNVLFIMLPTIKINSEKITTYIITVWGRSEIHYKKNIYVEDYQHKLKVVLMR